MERLLAEEYRVLLKLFWVANKYFFVIFVGIFLVVFFSNENKQAVFSLSTFKGLFLSPVFWGSYFFFVLVLTGKTLYRIAFKRTHE